jgi:hypothetical protein
LTGTPRPESYEDVFAPTLILDDGERFGRHITHFQARYFDYNPYTRKQKPKDGAAEEIMGKLSGIAISMQQKDYLGRPEPLSIRAYVSMSDDEMKIYEQMEETRVIEMTDGTIIESKGAAALANKLLQLASGIIYDQDGSWHRFHDRKIQKLREIREKIKTPLLVACWFKPSFERILSEFPKSVRFDKNGTLETAWNRGEIDMMLVHPAGSAYGSNLQLGPGHDLVFFDIPYPLVKYLQIIRRLDRRPMEKTVRVWHIITRGTADEGMVPMLIEKKKPQTWLMTRLSDIRKERDNG